MTLFIAGTDTGVGKTFITGQLLKAFHQRRCNFVSQKWVQTGCTIPEDLISHLKTIGKAPADYEPYFKAMCPYLFKLPASPHLAAQEEGKHIQTQRLLLSYHALKKIFDGVLVEGSGGVMVPLNESETTLDVVATLKLPTLLVVGNRLGCINHALLSIKALQQAGIQILGLIFNQIGPNEDPKVLKDNPMIVEKMTGIKVLQSISYTQNKVDLSGVLSQLKAEVPSLF